MKKIFIALMLGLLMVSCGGSNGTSSSSSGSSSGGYYRTEKTDELKTLLGDRYLGIKEIDYDKYMKDSEISGISGYYIGMGDGAGFIRRGLELAGEKRTICRFAFSEEVSLDIVKEIADKYDMVFINPSIESFLTIRESLGAKIFEYPYMFMFVPREYIK